MSLAKSFFIKVTKNAIFFIQHKKTFLVENFDSSSILLYKRERKRKKQNDFMKTTISVLEEKNFST